MPKSLWERAPRESHTPPLPHIYSECRWDMCGEVRRITDVRTGLRESLRRAKKTVVIEDLISTGGSVIDVVDALREAGADVLGIVSIFTYGMKKGLDRLEAANVKNVSLTDFDSVIEAAAESGYIKPEDASRLRAFRDNPSDESWIKA